MVGEAFELKLQLQNIDLLAFLISKVLGFVLIELLFHFLVLPFDLLHLGVQVDVLYLQVEDVVVDGVGEIVIGGLALFDTFLYALRKFVKPLACMAGLLL